MRLRVAVRDASVWTLIAFTSVVLSFAQTTKPAGGSAAFSDAGVNLMSPGDAALQQAYLRGPENAPSHPPLGLISGTILDQTGAVTIGAHVSLSHEGQASYLEVQSGNNGQFLFSNVVSGPFCLTVTATGFASHEFSATLKPGETLLIPPIVLAVAKNVTEVHVSATALSRVQIADLQIQEQQKQRVFGFLPNFYVTYDADAVPLVSRQKFRLAWKTMSDPMTVVGVAAIAGLEHATDTFPGYGQGAQGYFKRLGATYTDTLTGTYIGSAILPSLLKQDPRYFYKGTGSAKSRLLYALRSTVICRGDNMRWQPNYSNVGGAFASAGISYLYYPETDRNGAGLVFRNSLLRLGETAFENVLQEFVIRRLTPGLRKRASDQR